MNERRQDVLQVLLVCFVCAVAGGFLALKVAPTGMAFLDYLVGMVSGSLAGYVAIDWRGVIVAIPKAGAMAWRAVTNWKITEEKKMAMKLACKLFGWYWLGFCIIYFTIILIPLLALSVYGDWSLLFVLVLCTFALATLPSSTIISGEYHSKLDESIKKTENGEYSFSDFCQLAIDKYHSEKNKMINVVKIINPISVYLYYLPRGLFWLITRGLSLMVKFLLKFVWCLVKLTCSDKRIYVTLAIAIGVTVACLNNNIWLGGIVAASLGAVGSLLETVIVSKQAPQS